eukprot:1073384-Prymnesium_polylepis.1
MTSRSSLTTLNLQKSVTADYLKPVTVRSIHAAGSPRTWKVLGKCDLNREEHTGARARLLWPSRMHAGLWAKEGRRSEVDRQPK